MCGGQRRQTAAMRERRLLAGLSHPAVVIIIPHILKSYCGNKENPKKF